MAFSSPQSRVGSLLPIAACLAGLLACGDDHQPPPCQEALDDSSRCCDPTLYRLLSSTEIASGADVHVGVRVETEGIADWQQQTGGDPECECAGSLCSCITPIALASAQCPTAIRLTGLYRGRPVECNNAGCWPLQVLASYRVCGTLTQLTSATWGPVAALDLEAFCPL